jgi:AdoMet-dependent rRNA methyltransferase SPB1
MPSKVKHTHRDKYFNLAKAQGYRARSAFKLIQLNKKFDFLSTASVCIDLCAAPGGWCQVAQKCMPAMSTIIGIDLLPIRAMRGVKTFQCDITTPLCRQLIKTECKGQKQCVDVVLCDGAPNVGANYTKDAFVQNELALVAMKLAIDVLKPGGWFVTKVFRSQDYNSLLWVFKQLFKTVQANKPLSSRNESAEIFVVCEGFFAPDRIDPKLLDPRHVFVQVEAEPKPMSIFHKKFGVQKRHRQGYAEDLNANLTRIKDVMEYIDDKEPIDVLSITHQLAFGDSENAQRCLADPCTTEEVKRCCDDLRVVDKMSFKMLLKWRTEMRDMLYGEERRARAAARDAELAAHKAEQAAKMAALTPEERQARAEKELDGELAEMRDQQLLERRRVKKKEAKKAAKVRERVALGMNDAGAVVDNIQESVFKVSDMRSRRNAAAVEAVRRGAMTEAGLTIADKGADDAEWDDAMEAGGLKDVNFNPMHEMVEGEGEVVSSGDEEAQLDYLYRKFNERKGDISGALKRAVKRSKVAKAAAVGNELMTASAQQDGDYQRYLEELGAGSAKARRDSDSDPESASSSEDEDEAAMGRSMRDAERAEEMDDGTGGSQAEVRAARWFSSHPLLAEVDDEEEERMVDDAMASHGLEGGSGGDAGNNRDASHRFSSSSSSSDDDDSDGGRGSRTGAADAMLALMPKTDKQMRSEKRKKTAERCVCCRPPRVPRRFPSPRTARRRPASARRRL